MLKSEPPLGNRFCVSVEATHPGLYVDSTDEGAHPIFGGPTSLTAFVGRAENGPENEPVLVHGFADFERVFGGLWVHGTLGYAVRDYFQNGGREALIVRLAENDEYPGDSASRTGLYALEKADAFNLLCIPPPQRGGDVAPAVWRAAAEYCSRRGAFLLIDAPTGWTNAETAKRDLAQGPFSQLRSPNAALYFPGLELADPLMGNRPQPFVASGAVAGIFARMDAARGIWQAPAGVEAYIEGVHRPTRPLADVDEATLIAMAVNCIHSHPSRGILVWGCRTMVGADDMASPWKYIPVRRTALYIEESLRRSTQWTAFEPNAEPLWSRLHLNVSEFMHRLFRQGAFQGLKPPEAYFVKCDGQTTTPEDVTNGRLNILVGFAPLKPGEFVVLRFSQTMPRPS